MSEITAAMINRWINPLVTCRASQLTSQATNKMKNNPMNMLPPVSSDGDPATHPTTGLVMARLSPGRGLFPAELLQVLLRNADPVLVAGRLLGMRDVALPGLDGLGHVHLLVRKRQIVERA